MALLDNLFTLGVLLSLAIIGYCKIKNITIVDLWREIMEILRGETEEVVA